MYGQSQFAEINARLNQIFQNQQVLCVAHRGVSSGMVVENTTFSTLAAIHSGADMVEIDVARSSDGVFFAFHDGLETHLLGENQNLNTLTAHEVHQLRYLIDGRPHPLYPIEQLTEVLRTFKGQTLFNVDRSWSWWPELLPALDSLGMDDQLLLKAPANHPAIDVLRAHDTKFPFMPICTTLEQARAHLDDPALNLVGLELLAKVPTDPLFSPETAATLSAGDAFLFANAEVVDPGSSLCAGYDDASALAQGPDPAWGELVRRGFRAIQTDWPWLLRAHLNANLLDFGSADPANGEV